MKEICHEEHTNLLISASNEYEEKQRVQAVRVVRAQGSPNTERRRLNQ